MAKWLCAACLVGSAFRAGAREVDEIDCPGTVNLTGFGRVALVPTGWAAPNLSAPVRARDNEITATLGARAYWADDCAAGRYNHTQYLALNLLGKTMRYTSDLSGLGCGCNAAFYLTSMHQNTQPSECSDYYCDANNVCGQSCAEIDIQEGNKFSWHSTLHGKFDHGGRGAGIGGGGASWNGPRDWKTSEYGPGASCIDTSKPFQVEVGFPADAACQLLAMEITLSQAALSDCKLTLSIAEYSGMPEMTAALAAGMTPIVSYWNSGDMLWMDGKGQDGQGPCATDSPDQCGKKTKFSNFSVAAIPGNACMHVLTEQIPAQPALPPTIDRTTATTTTAASGGTTAASGGTSAASGGTSGDSDIRLQVVGPLGFLAGAFSASLVIVVMGYIRSRQSQQIPERPEMRTFQRSLSSNNYLMSQASIMEQREAEQA